MAINWLTTFPREMNQNKLTRGSSIPRSFIVFSSPADTQCQLKYMISPWLNENTFLSSSTAFPPPSFHFTGSCQRQASSVVWADGCSPKTTEFSLNSEIQEQGGHYQQEGTDRHSSQSVASFSPYSTLHLRTNIVNEQKNTQESR